MGDCRPIPGPGFLCFRGAGRAGPRCRFCLARARWQCDQLLDGGPLTCDAFLCDRHRFVRDRGVDYCPDHWAAYATAQGRRAPRPPRAVAVQPSLPEV